MSTTPEQRAENDLRVAENIRKYGCHVISVFDPEEKLPNFSYSIGIQETTGAPEALVIGLSVKLGHAVINEYLRQLRSGIAFARGVPCTGFLDGFPVYVEPARKKNLSEYTLGCERYYGRKPFRVVQIIYPTTSGIWPWEKEASEWFRNLQPMLGRLRADRP